MKIPHLIEVHANCQNITMEIPHLLGVARLCMDVLKLKCPLAFRRHIFPPYATNKVLLCLLFLPLQLRTKQTSPFTVFSPECNRFI